MNVKGKRLAPADVVYSDIFQWIVVENADTVQNYDALNQKIMHVIGTVKRSRKYRPNFGCDVAKYLFEPFDETTADWIKTYIRIALEDPANGLTNDITDIAVSVVMSTEQNYLCFVTYRAPRLEEIGEVKFALQPQ